MRAQGHFSFIAPPPIHHCEEGYICVPPPFSPFTSYPLPSPPPFRDGESQFGVVIANTIGYLLDLGGPRGDIIKGVTNLQLHHGTGEKIRKIVYW